MGYLFLDIELGRDDGFYAMAARRDGEQLEWVGQRTRRPRAVSFEQAHRELVDWLRPDDVLVGHNLLEFDRRKITERFPRSPLLHVPVVDTLVLSVLCWPARPYHALAKDDQLVRDALPNPVSDVRASERILLEALPLLRALPEPDRELLRALVPRVRFQRVADPRGEQAAALGWRHLFRELDWDWRDDAPLDLTSAWAGRVCRNAPLLQDPPLDLGLVLLAAWLRIASRNDGSVLPGWVRRQWPETTRRIKALRATACEDPHCAWCSVHLSPEYWLRQVFDYESYRTEPATSDGSSLQRMLVARGLRGESTFGILPTGGGKSLCFQVPAEARHRLLGQLTVVVSPLQSLMKDQIDALASRIPHARAIYSGLPALLRPQIMDQVRSGECGLLYLSPEQFRNEGILRLLAQRDIGAVVFDEAHCLSQWGHDFRTDYPYVLKAMNRLMEAQGVPMPPVFLFTATTQRDATDQILAHVTRWTGSTPELFDGGSARDNLTYRALHVPRSQRIERITALIEEHAPREGSVIVFCGSRRATEDTAQQLSDLGYAAVAYHAGLDADRRRTIQDEFLKDEHRIITATNAFGMGVDKPNVRLVVHLDMPSSLEAYLQEAGRAGRDREPAMAVLLWAPGDAEPRFRLNARSDLDVDDLDAVWRGVEGLPAWRTHDGTERRVVTPRELLFRDELRGRFDPYDDGEETRIKAAVNWLEEAHVLERRENETRVFTGRPRLPSLAQALREVERLDLPPKTRRGWETILRAIYDAGDDGLSADGIAVLAELLSERRSLEGGLDVLRTLKQMVESRLLTPGQTFTALLRRGTRSTSADHLSRWSEREQRVQDWVREQLDETGRVDLRVIAERLTGEDAACTEREVVRLLQSWTVASAGFAEQRFTVRFRKGAGSMATLHVDDPVELGQWLELRRHAAVRVFECLEELVREERGKELVASTELEHLVARIEADLVLHPRLRNSLDATLGAIAWMHEMHVITVQNGLTVFWSAMNLDRRPGALPLRGQTANSTRNMLEKHLEGRILRIHVMDAWAQKMLSEPEDAERFRADWFALPQDEFKARWFPKQEERLRRPTTPESWARIVEDLNDPIQQQIVTRDVRRNHLVVAGPGSGKTRILVHRIAWLLRVRRVRAHQILVLCYTRANAIELNRRLRELVDDDARGVRILTLHALALGIVGGHRLRPEGTLSLDDCIPVAARMLRGEDLDEGEKPRQRDALLRGTEFLFVDEYQDLDAPKYELLSALTGRGMSGRQRKLKVFAVGDDDQAIFTFDGARTDFIRSFESDYQASRFLVPHNYRNPSAVLELAQQLVLGLPGRLKQDHVLRVDDARRGDPPMGPWATQHPRLRGRIPWRRHPTVRAAASDLMQAVAELLAEGVPPESIGVLTRTRPKGLHRLRIAAERSRIPFTWPLPSERSVPVTRIREVITLAETLTEMARVRASDERALVRSSNVARHIDALGTGTWAQALRSWLEPLDGRVMPAEAWRRDLLTWARLERRARTIGSGVHLGTMHSAKGLEFDHVLLLDDGELADRPEERRLLYVALTRARRSLQIFSPWAPSPAFRALHHPVLQVIEAPELVADAAPEHDYGLISQREIFIDWLGRRDARHPGHQALELARPGDAFTLQERPDGLAIVDAGGREVGRIASGCRDEWAGRIGRDLRLRLVAVTRERADEPGRPEEYRRKLRMEVWWTGVWEARWRRL